MPQTPLEQWLEATKAHAATLAPDQKACLLEQLAEVDWPLVGQLVAEHVLGHAAAEQAFDLEALEPAEFIPLPETDEDREQMGYAAAIGQSLMDEGRVGVVIVAGGQGSRLGFEGPKGTYPIGPISQSSLFYFHARRVLAHSRRAGRHVPLLVMTSPENDAATRDHFQANHHFGLNPAHVRFFTQGQLPAVDKTTGLPLFSSPARLALSPDGHGGCLYALCRKSAEDGLSALEWAENFGVTTLFYFQVDNPLVRIADPTFLGLHAANQAQVSFKIVCKQAPEERVGVVCRLPDGRNAVIEYSDLPDTLAQARRENGNLKFRAGSIAVHIFETEFLKQLALGRARLPFHKALKKVPFWDAASGRQVSPTEPNAVKFEAFIFDTLPMATNALIVETDRRLEFEPLKNATGPDSPETVRAAMCRIAADIMNAAGHHVPRDLHGQPTIKLEFDPCVVMEPEDLAGKLWPGFRATGDVCLREQLGPPEELPQIDEE